MSKTIPIGILTRNRVSYLDVTLRSLSASTLPKNQKVILFDDASDDQLTLQYYSSNDLLDIQSPWPSGTTWRRHGLGIINNPYRQPVGIQGLVPIHRFDTPSGVINASCKAINHLFEQHPDAPGVFLLQDDVVFKQYWFRDMYITVRALIKRESLPFGLLAGLKINTDMSKRRDSVAVRSGITAQCLYISRRGYTATQAYFKHTHKRTTGFDDTLNRAMHNNGMWSGCRLPFVCQHTGVVSVVRPYRKWWSRKSGRIGYHVQPPYVLATKVKRFA